MSGWDYEKHQSAVLLSEDRRIVPYGFFCREEGYSGAQLHGITNPDIDLDGLFEGLSGGSLVDPVPLFVGRQFVPEPKYQSFLEACREFASGEAVEHQFLSYALFHHGHFLNFISRNPEIDNDFVRDHVAGAVTQLMGEVGIESEEHLDGLMDSGRWHPGDALPVPPHALSDGGGSDFGDYGCDTPDSEASSWDSYDEELYAPLEFSYPGHEDDIYEPSSEDEEDASGPRFPCRCDGFSVWTFCCHCSREAWDAGPLVAVEPFVDEWNPEIVGRLVFGGESFLLSFSSWRTHGTVPDLVYLSPVELEGGFLYEVYVFNIQLIIAPNIWGSGRMLSLNLASLRWGVPGSGR